MTGPRGENEGVTTKTILVPIGSEDTHPESDAMQMLLSECVQFVRAGGCITLDDWQHLTERHRYALAEAGSMVAAERALAIATSFRDPESILYASMTPQDAELEAIRIRLSRMAQAAANPPRGTGEQ